MYVCMHACIYPYDQTLRSFLSPGVQTMAVMEIRSDCCS